MYQFIMDLMIGERTSSQPKWEFYVFAIASLAGVMRTFYAFLTIDSMHYLRVLDPIVLAVFCSAFIRACLQTGSCEKARMERFGIALVITMIASAVILNFGRLNDLPWWAHYLVLPAIGTSIALYFECYEWGDPAAVLGFSWAFGVISFTEEKSLLAALGCWLICRMFATFWKAPLVIMDILNPD